MQAGLLEGDPVDVGEILVLDATALLVAEYLVLRYEGAPERARTEYGLATRVAAEWFPSRAIAFDAALAAGTGDAGDVDAPRLTHLDRDATRHRQRHPEHSRAVLPPVADDDGERQPLDVG